jgi:RNA polymerase-binding transcription factor
MPLTAAQLRHLEHRLLEERDRVTRALARYADETHDTRQEETGDLSAFPSGAEAESQEFDAANAARETAELAEIDAALERLYQRPEEYGRCERGGEPIPFERLDALPRARTCITHST